MTTFLPMKLNFNQFPKKNIFLKRSNHVWRRIFLQLLKTPTNYQEELICTVNTMKQKANFRE